MQSPDISQNYFELFGLSVEYDLDLHFLHSEQQNLQSQYHPDRFAAASDQERRTSVQIASHINQAYETLKDPVKRAFYLLEQSGAAIPDDSQTTSDTVFLMEQMELREAMEGCREAQDPIQCSEEINIKLSKRKGDLAAEFVTGYQSGDFDAACAIAQKMQFIQRLQHQLDELQYELEDA